MVRVLVLESIIAVTDSEKGTFRFSRLGHPVGYSMLEKRNVPFSPSLTIDPAVARRAKKVARAKNTSVSGLVEELLRRLH